MDLRRYTDCLDLGGILSVLIPFSVYLLTLAPSVTFFDSGEFITAIYSLGSAHSPGYPTFINYAKPFTYLPFGSIAFRVNVATAFSSALACFGLYLLVSWFLKNETLVEDVRFSSFFKKMTALSAALTFAFSARLWLQTNHDKPYPLVSFLVAIIFYLLLLWRSHYKNGEDLPKYIYLASFLAGMTFGAHQTIVLLIPAYSFLILSVDWRLIKRVKEILLAFVFAVLGLSIHLYLPIRASVNPVMNWGDPKTYTQFLWHILRKGYPVEKPERSLALLWDQVNAFNIPNEFTYIGLFIIVIGIIAFYNIFRDEVLTFFIGILTFVVVIVGYLNTPTDLIFLTEEFFTPIYLLSAVFIGLGMFLLLKKALAGKSSRYLASFSTKALTGLILLSLPCTVCALHYIENDQHENYVAFDYATNTLRSIPENGVLYTWGDSGAFPLWYLQWAEKMREDLDLLHTPHLVFKWYLDSFPVLFKNSILRRYSEEAMLPENALKLSISELVEKRPLYIDFSTRYSIPLEPFSIIQHGICYQINKDSLPINPPDASIWNVYSMRGVSGEMFFKDLDTGKAILIYANSHMESGETYLKMGKKEQGIAELIVAERISPELRFQISKILLSYGH